MLGSYVQYFLTPFTKPDGEHGYCTPELPSGKSVLFTTAEHLGPICAPTPNPVSLYST